MFRYLFAMFNPQSAEGGHIGPLRIKKTVSLELSVGLTSNQGANLSFSVVYAKKFINELGLSWAKLGPSWG